MNLENEIFSLTGLENQLTAINMKIAVETDPERHKELLLDRGFIERDLENLRRHEKDEVGWIL